MKPFMSAVPRPYKSSPTLVMEYGSVAHPVPAGTTSVCPDSISPPAVCGPNETSRFARPSPPSSTVAAATVGLEVIGHVVDQRQIRCSALGREGHQIRQEARQFVAGLVDDCVCWHDVTV